MNFNKNLNKAKTAKNDEFFTRYSDIENELQYYKDCFKDKIIYCNCDAEWSNFYKYFKNNFQTLGIKKLITSSYVKATGDGDFRSAESIKLLKECDIVVTNPPFSLFRDFINLMTKYDKKFLIIGNKNAVTYKETFKLIKDSILWLGVTNPNNFIQPIGDEIKNLTGLCKWFTNLKSCNHNKYINCIKEYSESEYPKYDNFDVIEVSRVKNIPKDYKGLMGVPITFLDNYNTEQFEIVSCSAHPSTEYSNIGALKLNGKNLYARIFIKHKF